MSVAFAAPAAVRAAAPGGLALRPCAEKGWLASEEPLVQQGSAFLPAAAAATAAALALSARRNRPLPAKRTPALPPAARRRTCAGRRASGDEEEEGSDPANNAYAYRMVRNFIILTFLPFFFCLKNFFYNPRLSDFDFEYGPHLAHPTLRTTSTIQAIMVGLALLWREKNRDAPIDRLFAWLFVPEAVFHILLHFLSHHNWIGNFAFGYAFGAGIALPGFLSLMAYCPKNKWLPWFYMVLYFFTQIPITNGLTDMIGPAKMRLNFANLNTATITGPFFYGIMKRWKDVPKLPVFLATGVITYQVTMGIIGPINSGGVLKLYDPSVIMQHAIVDIGFGFAYAASIYYGLFLPGRPQPRFN